METSRLKNLALENKTLSLENIVSKNREEVMSIEPDKNLWWGDDAKDCVNKEIKYKYNENIALKELSQYIDSTYDEHYSKNKFQATEFIIDGGHGEGFCIGNILKYAQRYGKKNGRDRKDLLKVIHYSIIALYINEMENE